MTGITEPIEFAFIFVSPILFIFHAIMSGLSFMIMSLVGVAIGNVQGGFIDLAVFGVLRGLDTRWYFTVILGILYIFAYYFFFKFIILKRNLKTPGREIEENGNNYQTTTTSSTELGQTIVEALGGKENIQSIDNCFTRLRLVLKDSDNINEATLKQTGAVGIVKINETNLQVIYGPQVESIALKVKDAADLKE